MLSWIGCEIIILVKQLHWLTIIILKSSFLLSVEASVSRNPFLRPGSKQKPPPPPVRSSYTPNPVPQKDMSKEIEFRGYFFLKGKPFFCLLNKKSNHAEWVSLSEITYEQFEASEFDMESEVLTVIYEGSRYDLSLIQGGSSIGPKSDLSKNKTASPINSKRSASSTVTSPRYMPPRPKSAPQLPTWLVNRNKNSFSSSSGSGSSAKNTFSNAVPRRIIPNLPQPNRNDFSNDFTSPSSSSSQNTNNPNNIINRITRTSSGSSSESTVGNVVENVIEDSSANISADSDFDLDSLPPPPPPPNITPPSPPPNILPSREN